MLLHKTKFRPNRLKMPEISTIKTLRSLKKMGFGHVFCHGQKCDYLSHALLAAREATKKEENTDLIFIR